MENTTASEVGLAVSTVIFSMRDDSGGGEQSLWIPLVRRTREPFLGQWALPGGPVGARDSLVSAAAANLQSTTGLVPRYLEQLYAFGDLDRARDASVPRLVTIAYWALVREVDTTGDHTTKSISDDPNVDWFRAGDEAVLADLAFDHRRIIEYALWRLRNKVEYGFIAHHLLGERFTLAQVREVYETVLGRSLDPANFRRQLKATTDLVETDEFLEGVNHRPPRLYRFAGTREPAPEGSTTP